MKKYVVEFIGTLFLVLVIAFTGNPIAIGGVLIALVYMGGAISGAHYNPAVTIGLWRNKKIDTDNAIKYIILQVTGSLTAALIYALVTGNIFVPSIGQNVNPASAFLLEALFTFLLVTVVYNTAVSDKVKGNSYFGLAIGLTIMAGAFVAGPISGAVFNPAVGVGPILFDIVHIGKNILSLLVYIVGPITGGLIAAYVYKLK